MPESDTVIPSFSRQDTIIIQEKNREGVVIRRYSRGRFLGKGGFARCYQLTCLERDKKYAVKVIEKSSLTRSKAKQKLNSQIKIHKAMKSEYVVGFHHYFEDEDNVYILLEICQNQTLNELIKRRKRITEIQAKYYLHQIISGVQDIHNSNVIHRDLKLGNLFLTDKLQIKIGDFGLAAKLASNSEKRKTMCGTPNYIAPEILENNGHSFEVDVWSIGVIAYAFVCGRPPFETNDVKTTYQKIKTCNYSFPDSINLSPGIRKFISKMLMRDPSRRATIDELLHEDFFTKIAFPRVLPTSLLSHPPNSAFIKQYSECDLKQAHGTSTQSRANSISKTHLQSKGLLTGRFQKQNEKDSLGRVMVRAQSNERLDQRNHAIQRACSTNVLMPKKKSFSKEQMPVALQKKCQEGPVVWVTYFESNPKFGISYILNSNAIGMKFNDSTYMISNSNFTKLKYQSSSQTEKTAQIFQLGRNPESLNKKVKIITHYQKQLNKRKQQEESMINNQQRISREKLRFRQSNQTALSIWVVKHQATSKVTMFWFNNKDQQFIFKDHTQILISNERNVTYVNKVSERKHFSIVDINQQSEEIKKRMNYTNSILQNMREQNVLKNIENEPNRDNQPTLTRSSSMATVDKLVQPVLVRSNSTLNRLQSYKNLR